MQRRLSFPLSGTGETPGVITMRWSDAAWTGGESVTVVFNATPAAATQTVPGAARANVALHPVLRDVGRPGAADGVVRPATGTFTVPARSVAVFVGR